MCVWSSLIYLDLVPWDFLARMSGDDLSVKGLVAQGKCATGHEWTEELAFRALVFVTLQLFSQVRDGLYA